MKSKTTIELVIDPEIMIRFFRQSQLHRIGARTPEVTFAHLLHNYFEKIR